MAVEILLDVEHIFLVVVPCQLIVGVLGQVILVGEKRPDAAQLEDALAAVHDGQFIPAHKFFAVMSSDELKSYKPDKNPGEIFTSLQSWKQVLLFGNQIRF